MKKLKITLNGKSYEVDVEILQDDAPSMPYMPTIANVAAPAPTAVSVAAPKAAPAAGGNAFTAPMNGVVIEVSVKAGDTVKSGQIIVVLEAMKMKTNITSDRDGKVASVNISPNDSVEAGQVMLTFA